LEFIARKYQNPNTLQQIIAITGQPREQIGVDQIQRSKWKK
jgi:hypothetical protein